MINSAEPRHVHELFSSQTKAHYVVPPYQREYSWHRAQWEALFADLVESEDEHFLGTIITLSRTKDSLSGPVLEVIDGQQRLTTLTILLAAVHSHLQDAEDLDEDARFERMTLRRELVRDEAKAPRLTPQVQGANRADYQAMLADAGLPVKSEKKAYYPSRKVAKAFWFFRAAITELAEERGESLSTTALSVLAAARRALIVNIEVASAADAFVLFESLNNRGVPLTPVDLIKNSFLARAEHRAGMEVEEAFELWSDTLAHLGDSYATHERFLRHFYNAFRGDLPPVKLAPVATRKNLIRIYETLLDQDLEGTVRFLERAARVYGRIAGGGDVEDPTSLDQELTALRRAQAAPSYVLVMWLLVRQEKAGWSDEDLAAVARLLVSFFVRRNLTGFPATYALPRLFMDVIDQVAAGEPDRLLTIVRGSLVAASASDATFRERLEGPVYEENRDVTRFLLATLAEDAMTKETRVDLWAQSGKTFVWTIEHILPQGENLPQEWVDALGGPEAAAETQNRLVHTLGNLTITGFNSTLGNQTFLRKRDRIDQQGRAIGYRNGLALNAELAEKEAWSSADIEARTVRLVERALERFAL